MADPFTVAGLVLGLYSAIIGTLPFIPRPPTVATLHAITGSRWDLSGADGRFPYWEIKSHNDHPWSADYNCNMGYIGAGYKSTWNADVIPGISRPDYWPLMKFLFTFANHDAICLTEIGISLNELTRNNNKKVFVFAEMLIARGAAWYYTDLRNGDPTGAFNKCVWLDSDYSPCGGDPNSSCIQGFRANIEWIGESYVLFDAFMYTTMKINHFLPFFFIYYSFPSIHYAASISTGDAL
jgi:hypothetical protein